MPVFAQQKATINVHPEQGKEIISKHIYGQFAEHLGTCIYGGLWVGEDSKIPNTQGMSLIHICYWSADCRKYQFTAGTRCFSLWRER